MIVADLNINPVVPRTVGDLNIPSWEMAAGRAAPQAPHLTQPQTGGITPMPSSAGGFQKTFPEYAVLEPNLLVQGLNALAKAPDIGLGTLNSLTGGVAGKAFDAVGSAVSPLIPDPIKQAATAAVAKFDELSNEGMAASMRTIQRAFSNDAPADKPYLNLGFAHIYGFGNDPGAEFGDAAKTLATALVMFRGPGLLGTLLKAGKLGSAVDATSAYARSFSSTFTGSAVKTALSGASTVATVENTAQKFGRFAGLATQAIGATGLAAEAVLPHVAGNEKWAQDILNTRVVPEDSPWRFPFEIATTLPMDLPSWVGAAKNSRVTSTAAEKLFGPGRNPDSFVFTQAKQAVENGVWNQEHLDAFNTHAVKQYAKQSLLDDMKNTSGATFTEIGQLPYVEQTAKALGVSTQDAANALISDRINSLYKLHGTDTLHRLASDAAVERFGWKGLPEAARIDQWREYYDTALPFERDHPELVLGVNDTNQVLQRDSALAWLKEQDTFSTSQRARFEANFPSFTSETSRGTENWARRLSKDELVKKLEAIDVPASTATISDNARLGTLRAQLEKTNAAILAGDKTLRPLRAQLLGEMNTIRDSAVEYHLNQSKLIETQLARREAEMLAGKATRADAWATGFEYEALTRALSDSLISAREARLSGSRWQLEHMSTGTARMRLVDDLGVRTNAVERTRAGRVWDRLFGAMPNKQLALKAEDFLYEQAGKAGHEPGKVDRFMALASDQLDLQNKENLFGFRRAKYASIYNLEPSVIDDLAAKAGLTTTPPGMKSWAEVMYRAYPGPLKVLQEALTGRSVKMPYNRTFTTLHRTMYPQLRFYFSPRFVMVNLQERNILGSTMGGKGYFGPENARLTRMAEGLDRYQTAANTSYIEIDALPKELGALAGQLTPQYMARNFVNALRSDPTYAPALRSMGVNPDNMGQVVKFLNGVLEERMKLAKFEVPLTQAEQALKTRIDELRVKAENPENTGLGLKDRTELQQKERDLLASVVKRHVEAEGAAFNKAAVAQASAAATTTPGFATNEALATARGKTFAPKTGASTTLSADEVGKAYESAKQAFLDAQKNGGVTRSIRGDVPQSGFAVSPYKARETVIEGRPSTSEDYRKFTRANLDLLSQPDHYIGGWTDTSTGKTYLDVSVVKSSREEAIQLAQDSSQLAVYDIASGQDIAVTAGAKAPAGPSATVAGTNGGAGGTLSSGVSDAGRGRVTQALLNALSRANFRALDDSRAIFLGNPERSALERGLNSYMLYWPISYQLKVGKALFNFLGGKAFNMPTGSAPAIMWAHIYDQVQQHIDKGDEIGQWFTAHKESLFLLQQFLPTTPDSFGATLSPFTRLAGATVGQGQDPNVGKLLTRVSQSGPAYDVSMFWRVIQETAKNLPKGN